MAGVRDWLSLVRFSHSIFALPFALASAWLAQGGVPELRVLFWVVVCAVAARTAAMAFNRLVDRRLDAANPRTRGRELPSGVLAPSAVGLLVVVSSAAFIAGAFALNPLCGKLALPVLVVLLGYSLVKRFSWLAHAVLGLSLALAPLGAWVAVTGSLAGDLRPPLLLAAAVLLWVFGFDLIYACQDAEHDRGAGLHSIPARFGVPAALAASSLAHAATTVLLVLLGLSAGLGLPYWLVLGVAAALLAWQHRIVAPDDFSRVDLAFFTLNGWVGIALFFGVAVDLFLAGGHA
ncbi:MAG: UbiA-like polyprenyltransferase [Planctomycetota bacterium]